MKVRFMVLMVGLSLVLPKSHAQIVGFPNVDFGAADSVAMVYDGHRINDLRALTIKLTQPLSTDVEKFRAIYKWVCNNIENDYPLFIKVKKQRQKLLDDPEAFMAWNNSFRIQVMKKLMKEQRTMCTGYAYLIKEMAFHAEITSKVVNGYGRTAHANIGGEGFANHSWNAVNLGGRWYLCDATWSSGIINGDEGTFVKQYDDAYFLADPTLFIRNHYPLDTTWSLLEKTLSLEEFLNAPLVYKGSFRHQVTPVLPDQFRTVAIKGEPITFSFKARDTVADKAVELKVTAYKTVISSASKTISNQGEHYEVDHTFKHKGRYSVHLLLDGEYVMTYSVEVGR
ncbi:MAG: transglutaminase domain-containing protein [Bacteroidota bacterium]